MNLLIPDGWLREYLKTSATPKQIREYLSLCGPSVERINVVGKETVYDMEVTSNRPDTMSVAGIGREAAAILPRFGIRATFTNNPYDNVSASRIHAYSRKGSKKLRITTDPELNPRFTAIVFENVIVRPSPPAIAKKLELCGIRPINTIVDITNYLMLAYGQPAHAFDFDRLSPKNNTATLALRLSRKGEKITTLDGKTHTLPGGDIVIEDADGTIIDLCGIMGGENSSIRPSTTTVILFLQTYDPAHIRRTSMSLAARTQAAALFEKGLDTELVLPAVTTGIDLVKKLSGATVASKLYDLYPTPYKPRTVTVPRAKIDGYMGSRLSDADIGRLLAPLGLDVKTQINAITVGIPSFRRDIATDVDVIEEIARIWGYHRIVPKLPDSEPPVVLTNPIFSWEEDVKIRLRDWGYTEIYGYSMISEEFMDLFGFNKTKTYRISNPLSNDLVFMRPSLLPGMVSTVRQNLNIRDSLALFELSMVYRWRIGDIPQEHPMLLVAQTGSAFRRVKGIAQALFDSMGVPFPEADVPGNETGESWYIPQKSLRLGPYGVVGELRQELLEKLAVKQPITVLELDFGRMVAEAKPAKSYTPIPPYPPSYEDLSFIFPPDTFVGPVMNTLVGADTLVGDVTLLDEHGLTRTFHITYRSRRKNLTADDIRPVREKLIRKVEEKFGATLRGQ